MKLGAAGRAVSSASMNSGTVADSTASATSFSVTTPTGVVFGGVAVTSPAADATHAGQTADSPP